MKSEKKNNLSTPADQAQNSLKNTTTQPTSNPHSPRQKRTSSKNPSNEYTDCGH